MFIHLTGSRILPTTATSVIRIRRPEHFDDADPKEVCFKPAIARALREGQGSGVRRKWARPSLANRIALAGLVVAAVAGIGVPVGLYVLGRQQSPNPPVNAARKEYQRRIREICADRAQVEAGTKARSDAIQQEVTAPPDLTRPVTETMVQVTQGLLNLALQGTNSSEGLREQLTALAPPPDLETIHNDSVAAWEREIMLERQFYDDLGKASTEGFIQMLTFIEGYDQSEVRQLDDKVNSNLIQLAGSGCRPSL